MQWVKSHLTLVITIAIGVLGLTGLALGIVMSDVAEQMGQDQATLTSLSSSKGTNADAIEAARKNAAQVRALLEKGLKEFESIGNHTPILPDVFPKVNPGDASPYKFKPLYNEALKAMLARLDAVDQPSEREYQREQEAIANALERQRRAATLGTDPKIKTTRPAGTPGAGLRPAPSAPPPGVGALSRSPSALENMTPEQLVQENPRVRASIKKARSGRCYANNNTFMLPELLTKDDAPTVEAMWYAQMMLWIEQDLVNALAAVNDSVAQALPAGEKRWVGNMPVKHVQKIFVGNYVPPAPAEGAATGRSFNIGGAGAQGGPPNDASSVFTKRGSDGSVDAVQIVLDLYINPLYMPAIIAEISRAGFYTPLLINYEAHSPIPSTDLVGYVYGSEPVIHATMLFEGCFLRSKYEKWMPAEVATAIKEGRAAMGVGPSGGGISPMRGGMPGMPGMQGLPGGGMPGGRFDGGT